MKVSSIEGLDGVKETLAAQAAKVKAAAAKAKAAAEKAAADAKAAASKVATVGLAPGRGAFLLLVQFNVRGFASRLAAIDQQKLHNKWNEIGGNFTTLTEAINKGKGKKAILGTGHIGYISGIGVEPVSTATTLATAAPVILEIVKLLKQLMPNANDEELNGITTEAEQTWSEMHGGDMSQFDFALQRGKETTSANENLKNDPTNTGTNSGTSSGNGTNSGNGNGTNSGNGSGAGFNLGEIAKKYWWIPAIFIGAKVAKII